MSEVRIATRGSKLALWQAEHVRDLLVAREPELQVSLLVLKTTGDRITDRPLSEVGGKGLFTKEIEEALLAGQAQVAVHSMKDMPAQDKAPAGLVLAAVPLRADPRDALLCRPGLRQAVRGAQAPLLALPQGATVGTSSLRRALQLRLLRPDLRILPLRGNVDTRLRKLDAGEMDAAVLAAAGLLRLGHGDRIDAVLQPAESLPAVGQGALALQCREDDAATRERLLHLDHQESATATVAERAFLLRLQGDCKTPLAAHAVLVAPGTLSIDGLLADPEGTYVLRDRVQGPAADAAALGRELADRLLSRRPT